MINGYRDFEINAKYPNLLYQTINGITTGKNFTHISSQYGISRTNLTLRINDQPKPGELLETP